VIIVLTFQILLSTQVYWCRKQRSFFLAFTLEFGE